MTFNSVQFLIFLPVVVAVYFLLPHKIRWVWALAASYYAYMSWNAWLIFPILGTTAVSYAAAMLMGRTSSKARKRVLLVITLVVCLGTLVFFKYFNFLLSSVINFLNLFTLDIDSVALDIILTAGISFYTFQTLSYVIDVYRGTIPPERHFGYYALFVSYFPQLVAGPIERPENLIPQLKEKHSPNSEDLAAGFRMLLVGFIRKCVIADYLGTFVNSAFSDISNANSLAIITACALFMLQLYNDFAGYSDIAVGAARLMGIRLMKNFDKPFSATSMRDFMRRWHISLNTWFRDYLYIPLGGSRKGKARKIFNIILVYFLCGLWHGANWTFVLWGLYVGLFIILEDLIRKPYRAFCSKRGIDNGKAWIVLIRRVIVFVAFLPASLLFRAQTVGEAGDIFLRLFSDMGFGNAYFEEAMASLSMVDLDLVRIALCLVSLVMLYRISDYVPERISSPGGLTDISALRCGYASRVAACFYGTLAVALAWIVLVSGNDVSAFVYFQF